MREPCEHHWISTHQPDFPDAVYWIRQCSLCGDFDGADLSEQVAAALLVEREDREKRIKELEGDGPIASVWSLTDWHEFSNDLASLLPERYDGDEAQESIILRAVADLVAAETYWHAEAEKWMRMVVQCDGRIAALKAQDETEEDTVDARALLVIELRIADPSQIPNAIKAINPPTIPHFAGNVRVTMDAFGDDAADNPATAIINYLEGKANDGIHEPGRPGVSVRFYFNDADPAAECECGWRVTGDAAVDAFRAWWSHLQDRPEHIEAML